jgi:hypothetical protein
MEKVNIKVDLSIITHDAVNEHPFVNISLNGFPKFSEICERDTIVEINVEIEDDTENFLTIEYNNKDPKTDVTFDNNTIIKDKRVQIKNISFDDIQLDFFEFENPDTLTYVPIDPSANTATGFEATKLSWNGRTTLKFTTPIYIWLLENL